MTADTDDLEAAARALYAKQADAAITLFLERRPDLIGTDIARAAEWESASDQTKNMLREEARACALALPLLRDAMTVLARAEHELTWPSVKRECNEVLARWRKLNEG